MRLQIVGWCCCLTGLAVFNVMPFFGMPAANAQAGGYTLGMLYLHNLLYRLALSRVRCATLKYVMFFASHAEKCIWRKSIQWRVIQPRELFKWSQPSLVDIDSSIYALTMASDSDIAGFTTHFLRPIKMFLKTRPTVVISNDCARVTNKSTVGESFGVLTFLSFESRMKMQFFRASEPWEHRTAVAGGTWWQAQWARLGSTFALCPVPWWAKGWCHFSLMQLKGTMEPEDGGLEDVFPFLYRFFWVPFHILGKYDFEPAWLSRLHLAPLNQGVGSLDILRHQCLRSSGRG